MLVKMINMGVPMHIVKWVDVWLSNRNTLVRYNGYKSKTRVLTKGVPQGAVLSPLLFAIFINDIAAELDNDINVSLFADDAAIWTQHKNVDIATRKLEDAVNIIKQWSNKWQMTLNMDKTELLFSAPVTKNVQVEPKLQSKIRRFFK